MNTLSCISPIDSSILATRTLLSDKTIEQKVAKARRAQRDWAQTSLKERMIAIKLFLKHIEDMEQEMVPELAKQMGRPVISGGELGPFRERVTYMLQICESVLADYHPDPDSPDTTGITRYVSRAPLGLVLVVAPWNYPYLTAVNGVVPALLAGNAVILKHAVQTMLVGERFQAAMDKAGMPEGIFTNLLLSHDQTAKLLQSGLVDHLTFTGSVAGGKAMERSAAGALMTMNLELGGKDAALVLEDADITTTAQNLAEGAFFNSGQCCCGIERIYVERAIYQPLVDAVVAEALKLKLGNPLDQLTTLGPMAKTSFAQAVREQLQEAQSKGAKGLINPRLFNYNQEQTPYLAPQVLVEVDHSMKFMTAETFGPAVGIMPVDNEQQAIDLINDSNYGLTASIWTKDQQRAVKIGRQLEVGILFMNRCDYVDPSLVWSGTKDTGYGASLSKYGFYALTRPQSFHLKPSG